MQPYSVALAIASCLAVAQPISRVLPAQAVASSVEIVAAHWLRDNVLPERSGVVFDRRTTVDLHREKRQDRDPTSSGLIAGALGIPVATPDLRLACDSFVGCRSPRGHTSLAMSLPQVDGAEATVAVILLRRPTVAHRSELAELYRIRLKLDGDSWVVTGASVTVP